MARRITSQLAYEALALEGSLFNAEWLAKVAHLEAPSQKPEDYAVPPGLNLRDEIARAWRIAEALWLKFQSSRATTEASVGHGARAARAGASARVATEAFVSSLLAQTFGFTALAKPDAPPIVGERNFPISYAWHAVPIVIAAHDEALDEALSRFGEDSRRRSPFGLVQEYLNAADDALWGVVANGLTLRLVRDNSSLTRPAWLEADFERIFTEERFADFSALWLTIHASRFGKPGAPADECVLEEWRNAGRLAGVAARAALRDCVERALIELGRGFLSEPANAALRAALVEGAVTPEAYFQELLRLVYRLIFLLTAEERAVLHPPGSDPKAMALYERGYGLRRLRERAARASAQDRHRDLYAALKVTVNALAAGEPRLALPALGGLFAAGQTPELDAAELQNRHLLAGLWALAWISRDKAVERVNWRDMGPEELGSVYESLLELVPRIEEGAQSFSFAEGAETRGNERKRSGSYYTPDSLVLALLDSALEPVITAKRAERPDDEAAAILSITVIDPAVGSGHFLLAAARRLAAHLARVRAQGQPSVDEHRRAVRDVVSHCLFGVDRNPMALELAKISLWLEGMTPEAPLSFLDAHLVLGDALLGVLDPASLAEGIPNDAFKRLTGDDAAVCTRLTQRNREARRTLEAVAERGPQQTLGFATETMAAVLAKIDAMPDATLEAIAAKRAAYENLREARQDAGLAEDLLLAAYLMRKDASSESVVPTSEHLLRALTNQPVEAAVAAAARHTAREHRVFHWRDAFAHVFARGGFDCVVGNPPWEQLQISEEEFFAARAPSIAALAGARRKAAIEDLAETSPALFAEFEAAQRLSQATSTYARNTERFRLTATGKLNTYPLFAETALNIRAPDGRAGIIVPSGIATDNTTSRFFSALSQGQLCSLYSFKEIRAWFPDTDDRSPFSLLTIGTSLGGDFAFSLNDVEELKDGRRHFSLTPEEFARLNPNTRTCPVFRSEADAELAKKIYARVPVLWDENESRGNPWTIDFRQGLFNMTSDSGLFRTADRRRELADPVALYEAKMIHQFDHRWSAYAGEGEESESSRDASESEKADPGFTVTPRYWVERSEVEARLADKQWMCGWLMGWRDICRATDERTVIAAVFPRSAVGHTLPLWFAIANGSSLSSMSGPAVANLLLMANLNCLVLDFAARQKIGGTHLTYGYLKQFPVVAPDGYTDADRAYIASRVLELTYTAHDLKSFYDDLTAENPAFDHRTGPDRGQPFPWNPERRARLRAELDGCYARLYGLTRDELRFVLDPADVMGPDYPSETFRVLREREMREHGEYRTRRLVLEAWDTLEAERPLIAPSRPARRRQAPYPRYVPTGVPCCEAEDWLAGVICDAAAYGGPMSETALRLLLPAGASATPPDLVESQHEWLADERITRLPAVLSWLRKLLGLGVTQDIAVSADSDLSLVLGDSRTERIARFLVDSRRAEQQTAESVPMQASDEAGDGTVSPAKRA